MFGFNRFVEVLIIVLLLIISSGCSLPKKREASPIDGLPGVTSKPLPPEKTKELLSDVTSNWFYGHGVGDTALKAGTLVAFPPYAVVLLGNAALSVSGYETVGVSNFLPEDARGSWNSLYDGVTAGPGKVNAAVSGKEFRTPETIREDMREKYLVSESDAEPDVHVGKELQEVDPELQYEYVVPAADSDAAADAAVDINGEPQELDPELQYEYE